MQLEKRIAKTSLQVKKFKHFLWIFVFVEKITLGIFLDTF